MVGQIDLKSESDNLMRFKKNFAAIEGVSFPSPCAAFCHSAVMVESWEEGIPISEFFATAYADSSPETQQLRHKLASLGVLFYLKMILFDNFLHGDLQPGNLFVKFEDDGGNSIYLNIYICVCVCVCVY